MSCASFEPGAWKYQASACALPEAACAQIERVVGASPGAQLRVELASQSVTLPDGTAFTFDIDPFAKHCLASGVDELGYILSFEDRIAAYEQR